MKKMLTIVLALALVFSVAGSAFAFTGISEEETSAASKFTVKVELVDYNYGWADGIYYKTPVNRAYAINEVVGALITVVVPAESDEEVTLKLSTSNIKFVETKYDAEAEDDINSIDAGSLYVKTANKEYILGANDTKSNKTYKFFFQGQLTSDQGGSITAKIVDDDDDIVWDSTGVDVKGASGLKFNVIFSGLTYTIKALDDGENFDTYDFLKIKVDRKYLCKTMSIGLGSIGEEYQIATVNGKIAFAETDADGDLTGSYVVSGNEHYSELLAAYNEFADEFGFDYSKSGYLYKSFFTKLDGSVTVSDTAYVEPALPSSALLPDLAVTIPQTGSVSFAGFAMIALAVAAAVAVKKAR